MGRGTRGKQDCTTGTFRKENRKEVGLGCINGGRKYQDFGVGEDMR